MKKVENRTSIDLTSEQYNAISTTQNLLEKTFKRKIHKVSVNPNFNNTDNIWSIIYNFEREEYKEETP